MKEQIIRRWYGMHASRMRKWGYCNPGYTLNDFRAWVLSQDLFHELYDIWIESGKEKWLKPSIDRIDSDGIYELSNIQLMTRKLNVRKGTMTQDRFIRTILK